MYWVLCFLSLITVCPSVRPFVHLTSVEPTAVCISFSCSRQLCLLNFFYTLCVRSCWNYMGLFMGYFSIIFYELWPLINGFRVITSVFFPPFKRNLYGGLMTNTLYSLNLPLNVIRMLILLWVKVKMGFLAIISPSRHPPLNQCSFQRSFNVY